VRYRTDFFAFWAYPVAQDASRKDKEPQETAEIF
jgi:hypothetical protein